MSQFDGRRRGADAECHVFIVFQEYRNRFRPIRFQTLSSDEPRVHYSKFVTFVGKDYDTARHNAINWLSNFCSRNGDYQRLLRNSEFYSDALDFQTKWRISEHSKQIENTETELWMNHVDSLMDRTTFGGVG